MLAMLRMFVAFFTLHPAMLCLYCNLISTRFVQYSHFLGQYLSLPLFPIIAPEKRRGRLNRIDSQHFFTIFCVARYSKIARKCPDLKDKCHCHPTIITLKGAPLFHQHAPQHRTSQPRILTRSADRETLSWMQASDLYLHLVCIS